MADRLMGAEMPGPATIPDVSEILTWPQAVFGTVVVLALLVVPQVMSYLQSRRVSHEMRNNSGATLRDAVDRIEQRLAEQGDMLRDHIRQAAKDQSSNEERLDAIEERQPGKED